MRDWDYLLDEPEEYDYSEDDSLDWDAEIAVELYNIDELSANASSKWQNSREY